MTRLGRFAALIASRSRPLSWQRMGAIQIHLIIQVSVILYGLNARLPSLFQARVTPLAQVSAYCLPIDFVFVASFE